MNILKKVTIESLKKNPVRTLVTIIGIILSIAMFTAVTTSVSSVQQFMIDVISETDGSWYGSFTNVDESGVEKIESDKDISDVVLIQNIGYAAIDSANEYKPYIYVAGIKDNINKMLPIHMDEGRLPEDVDEIILPDHLASNGGVKYNVGDTITLSIGKRISDNMNLWQETILQVDEEGSLIEKLVDLKKTTYTVVGIYKRSNFENYNAPGYTALTFASVNNTGTQNVYIQTDNMKDIYDVINKYPDEYGSNINSDLIRFSGNSSENALNRVLYSLAAILMGLIMFGSISLIYNAFAISVSERTKQFGILKSIGATKRQMRQSVVFEAGLLASIGIPLGIISGIIGMAITFYCTQGLFAKFLNELNVKLSLHISVASILIAALVGFVTVIISAYIPARKASKRTAIEAIRQTADIHMKPGKVKTLYITYWIAGFPGMLASKNFKRNKKQYRSTVISIFLSVVLFVSATNFCSYLTDSLNEIISTSDYDLSYYYTESEDTISSNQLNTIIQSTDGMTETTYLRKEIVSANIFVNQLEEKTRTMLEKYQVIEDTSNFFETDIQLVFIQDSEYQKFLEENKYDIDKYMNIESPTGLVYDHTVVFEDGKYRNVKMLLEKETNLQILYSQDDASNQQITKNLAIGEKIDSVPFSIESDSGMIVLMYPYSARGNVLEGGIYNQEIYYYMKSLKPEDSYKKLSASLQEKGLIVDNLYNQHQVIETNQALLIVLKVFAYGFIVLISLIATANVFNTISTNIALRRREFAMLKSVGMTRRGFIKMLNYECLLYGLKGLIYGIPVSIGITYLIYKSISNGLEIEFYMPWENVTIAVVSVFLVVFTTMIYSMNRIKKDNPIETLKNENL